MSFLFTKASSSRFVSARYSIYSVNAVRSTFIPPSSTMLFLGGRQERDYQFRSASTKSTSKKAGSGKGDDAASTTTYFERKIARKQERVQQFQAKVERKLKLKERRPRDVSDDVHVKRNAFTSFWHPRLIREERWDRQARQQGKPWKYHVAALVERMPQVLPDQEEFEREFDELQSYLGQFGKEYPPEFVSSYFPESGTAPVSDEELLAMLPEGFVPAPRVTEADKSGQTDTLDRKLKTYVYLLINGRFPTTTLELIENDKDNDDHDTNEQESLLEAAQRAVREHTGSDSTLELYCPSQAPMAVHMKPDDDVESAYFGTKTFFMRLQYDDGTVPGGQAREVAWLDRSEIIALYDSNNKSNKEEHDFSDDQDRFLHYLL